MGTHDQPSANSGELSPRELADKLDRIEQAVIKTGRNRTIEIVTAVILSLATTASAWCAYQATLWGGRQTFELAAANEAGRKSSDAHLEAMQARSFEGSMLIAYFEAEARGDKDLAKLIRSRFPPESRQAIEDWLKQNPLDNASATENPFLLPQFVQPKMLEAEQHAKISEEKHLAAERADKTSDHYVHCTVLFASVLFFGGISGTFDVPRVRMAMLTVAGVLLAGTIAWMLSITIS
jgi:hypothetical protein